MKTIRRAFWLSIGVAIGWVWGFLSLRALTRRTRSALAPASIAESAADAGERVTRRVGEAVNAGRVEARRKESELREQFRGTA